MAKTPTLGTLTNEQAAKRAIVRTPSDNHVTGYSNNVALQVTPWDFKFEFARIEVASDQRLAFAVDVTLYMSPQHAKMFATMLSRNVKEYEAEYGPIELPKQLASGDGDD
jgi:trehalose/maltose hydrolase-like predicted phosphorylase